MDVVDVPAEVELIADLVLPEPTLPDGGLIPTHVGWIANGVMTAGAEVLAREDGLDGRPAAGEIGIVGWQLPDAVQVFRQEAQGDDLKRLALSYGLPCMMQTGSRGLLGEDPTPVAGHDGEEATGARGVGSPVVRYIAILPESHAWVENPPYKL